MKIYHNASCSKSQECLRLLHEGNEPFEVVEYLNGRVSKEDIQHIIDLLGVEPIELIRKNESVFKEKYDGSDPKSVDWIEAIVLDPILLQRPIVIKGNRAIIGRPPTRVLEL